MTGAMDEGKAREIIETANACDGELSRREHGQEMKARGFLQGCEQTRKDERERAKGLIIQLQVYHSPMETHSPKEKIEGCPICKAIAKYEGKIKE